MVSVTLLLVTFKVVESPSLEVTAALTFSEGSLLRASPTETSAVVSSAMVRNSPELLSLSPTTVTSIVVGVSPG